MEFSILVLVPLTLGQIELKPKWEFSIFFLHFLKIPVKTG